MGMQVILEEVNCLTTEVISELEQMLITICLYTSCISTRYYVKRVKEYVQQYLILYQMFFTNKVFSTIPWNFEW